MIDLVEVGRYLRDLSEKSQWKYYGYRLVFDGHAVEVEISNAPGHHIYMLVAPVRGGKYQLTQLTGPIT